MKQRHTYLFFISICMPFLGYTQQATQDTIAPSEATQKVVSDTLPPSEIYGLRLGADLSKPIRSIFDDDYNGFEIVADYRVYRGLYLALEIGQESLLREEKNINVEGSGNYLRAGIDYNVYKNWRGMQNSIYVGLRYGTALFDQTLNSYTIFTGTSYFTSDPNTNRVTIDNLNASWLEFIFGIKAELIDHLFLGVNVSLRRLIQEKTPDTFDNLYIPGFGKTNDFSDFGLGYSYTISYRIPLFKKKK